MSASKIPAAPKASRRYGVVLIMCLSDSPPACERMRDASATARSDEVTMAPETEDRMSLGAARREKCAMPEM